MSYIEQDDYSKKGSRVFKKCSQNGKMTTYLSKRDFYDHNTHVDPIEGVVLIDSDYIEQKSPVFCQILAAFRYGREDLDVLGLTFRKYLFLSTVQVYPPLKVPFVNDLVNAGSNINPRLQYKSEQKQNENNNYLIRNSNNLNQSSYRPMTKLQERLIRKLGPNAFPFYFEIPRESPSSVTLQPGFNDDGKPCGVDYELRTYIGNETDDKVIKRNSVCLMIRKFSYALEFDDPPLPIPKAIITKDFIMCPGYIRMEMSLDKPKYYHGENILVNLLIDNRLNRAVKKIKISVVQTAEIILFSRTIYRCSVEEKEFEEGMPILPFSNGWSKSFNLCPLLAKNRDKRGLAIDGKLKHEDTNLASSTIVKKNLENRENLGMMIEYLVKAKLFLGLGCSDVQLEVPFVLSHLPPGDIGEEPVPLIYFDPAQTELCDPLDKISDSVRLDEEDGLKKSPNLIQNNSSETHLIHHQITVDVTSNSHNNVTPENSNNALDHDVSDQFDKNEEFEFME